MKKMREKTWLFLINYNQGVLGLFTRQLADYY